MNTYRRFLINWMDRFENKIGEPTTEGCWPWVGTKSGNGYGVFWLNGRYELAHRLVALVHTGSDLNDRVVCHSCDTPACVNPAHLFLGDQKSNMQDMCNKKRHANQMKTCCPKGHEYSEQNTYIRKDKVGKQCKACSRISSMKSYYKRKDLEAA